MSVLLITIGFIGLFFILMSVRILLVKNGEFRGTCASQSPWLNKEGVTCGYCGKTLSAGETCEKEEIDNKPEPFPEVKRKG
jgi:hypothetical protein